MRDESRRQRLRDMVAGYCEEIEAETPDPESQAGEREQAWHRARRFTAKQIRKFVFLALEEIEAEGNVINFTGTTTMDIPCERIIAGLSGNVFERILVIGFIEGSENIYVASHSSEIGEQLLLIERAKYFLLHNAESV